MADSGCSADILHANHGCRDETTGHLKRQRRWRDIKMSVRMTKSHGVCDLTCDEGIITADCYNLTHCLIWGLIKLKALRISSTNRAHSYRDNDDRFISFQSPPTATTGLKAVHSTHKANPHFHLERGPCHMERACHCVLFARLCKSKVKQDIHG